jgi:hypothetical protein
MEDERIPNNVLHGKFHYKRPVGKPRTRWEDVVRRNTSQILRKRRRGDEQKTEKNMDVFSESSGPRRGCSAIDGKHEAVQTGMYVRTNVSEEYGGSVMRVVDVSGTKSH